MTATTSAPAMMNFNGELDCWTAMTLVYREGYGKPWWYVRYGYRSADAPGALAGDSAGTTNDSVTCKGWPLQEISASVLRTCVGVGAAGLSVDFEAFPNQVRICFPRKMYIQARKCKQNRYAPPTVKNQTPNDRTQ